MSESIPEDFPDASESLSFFQSETGLSEVQLYKEEIALGEIPLAPPSLIPQLPLDSDTDCACG